MYEIKYRDFKALSKRINGFRALPSVWDVKKIKHITGVNNGATPKTANEKYWDGKINWYTPTDFNSKALSESNRKITKKGLNSCATVMVPKGTILITCRAPIGYLGITFKPQSTHNQGCKSLQPREVDTGYLYYGLLTNTDYLVSLGLGTTFMELSSKDLKNARIPFPNLNEQQKIANFLDIKIAEFDAIISKKEQLIKKLEEARKSLISEVVTGKAKIVDGELVERQPDEIRDSGVEWLGMIPKEWKVKRIKHLLEYSSNRIKIGPFGSSLKLEELNEEYEFKVYGQENLIKEDFSKGTRYINQSKFRTMKQYELLEGDIAISMMGTIGKSQIVPAGLERGIMDSHLIRIRVNKNISNIRFLNMLIRESWYIEEQLKLLSNGSIMSGLNSSIIKNLIVYQPRVNEQNEIINYIDRYSNNIKTLINKSNDQIKELKQAKQALISETVTGKIDLRDWKIQEVE